jgi:putative ABC transport system substrate-binding protein
MGAAALVAPLTSLPQTARKMRVGVLSLGSPPPGTLAAFARELARLGHVEGRNLEIEWRYADGSNDRLATHARELVAAKVDAIFAVSTPAAMAAKQATSQIPVVIARVADPVRSGLVKSMARPDGNITGLASTFSDIAAKHLQLVMEAIPTCKHVAVLWNKRNPGSALGVPELESTSAKAGLRFLSLAVERSDEIQGAFILAKKEGAAAVILLEDLFVASQKSNILNLGMKHSLPIFAFSRDFAEAGAIVAYGPNIPEMYRRAAQYVGRILKGAQPRDLPIEQPSRYELIVNLRAAEVLGLTLPASLLLRADLVIR